MITERQDPKGLALTALAYTLWGVLPLFWKLLQSVPSLEVLAHRILWSFAFTLVLLGLGGRERLASLRRLSRRQVLPVIVSGVLISFNWYAFIWAVNSNHVIEASMGYYISPLVVVLLSVFVLKETLTKEKWLGMACAAAGVLTITVQYGQIPWVALVLAGSFSSYSLAKKMVQVEPLTGLFLEAAVTTPIALLYIGRLAASGQGAFGGSSFAITLYLMAAGAITALPLLFFAQGARRVRLSTVGFFQYIAPSLQLLLGIFVFGEYFSPTHLLSFGLIWIGVSIFLHALWKQSRRPLKNPA